MSSTLELDRAAFAAPPAGSALEREAARLKAAGALGRSDKLIALFDYLLARSLADRPPKEVEVAMDVFGRSADFEPGRDAAVRVYAHKLRQRLQSAYGDPAEADRPRLAIPRGEYRLVLEAGAAPAVDAPAPAAPGDAARRANLRIWALVTLLLVLATAGATWLAARRPASPAAREVAQAQAGPLWAPLLKNGLPTVIALGDYYIFGESENGMEVSRLVREYTVNSKEQLSEYLSAHPDKIDHYLDLDLRYLPIGAGAALRRLSPVLAESRGGLKVVMMSDLTPAMLKASNVVYVGYLSGMGWLRDVALTPSRYRIGETFDDVIDRTSGAHYASQGGRPSDGSVYRDYGYVSTFPGPEGGRVVVIAGTRDVALMQAAEDATRAPAERAAARKAGGADAFEALYEVDGLSRLNVGARLVNATPLEAKGLWSGGAPAHHLAAPAG